MSSLSDPADKLLANRALPDELVLKLRAAGISSRSELDALRDRVWATQPTREQLAELVAAKNPWAVLAEWEKQPRRRVRPDEPEIDSTLPRRAPAQTAPRLDLAADHLPKQQEPAAQADPYAAQLTRFSPTELRGLYSRFQRIHHLNEPGAEPARSLSATNFKIYQALSRAVQNIDGAQAV